MTTKNRVIWALYETDSNGNEYVVDVYPTRDEARANQTVDQTVRRFEEIRRLRKSNQTTIHATA